MPDLARMIADTGSDLRMRQAIVTATPAGGLATIRFGDLASTTTDDDIPGVRCLSSAPLADGDTVWVLQQAGALLVIGKVGDPISVGGGGVTDHGALTGLGDDDHPHYATDADLTAHAATAGHTHPNLATHDALGLATDTELAAHAAAADPHPGYETSAEAAAKITAHEAAGNPHSGYATDADLTAHAATSHGGSHPDLATHDGLGLATDAELATHAAAADPHTGYQKESEKNANSGYPGLNSAGIIAKGQLATGSADFGMFVRAHDTGASWTLLEDTDIPATIARDSEVTSAVAAHAAAGDPHTGYATDGDLSTHAATAGHTHPNLATHDSLGLATDAELAAHAAAADPHTGYLKETDISGLATPAIALGAAAAAGTGTTPIRHNSTIAAFDATAPTTQSFGDAAAVGTAAFAARRDHKHAMPANPVTAHEAASDPHTGYQKESEKNAASGYAGLDAGAKVATVNLGGSGADVTKFLRGDQTWAAPAGGGGGYVVLAYHKVTANQTLISSAYLTGLATASLTIAAGRRLRITGHTFIEVASTAMQTNGFVMQDDLVIGRFGGGYFASTSDEDHWDGAVIVEPAAGSHVYALYASCNTGTFRLTASAADPAYILVEDIGPV